MTTPGNFPQPSRLLALLRRESANSTTRGFTLVELLVTIGVISILMSCLLGALSGAKIKSRQIGCLNNIRQWTLVDSLYANEHGKRIPYDTPEHPGSGWWGALSSQTIKSNMSICPSTSRPKPSTRAVNLQGSAESAWRRCTSDSKTSFDSSYGYNGWLYSEVAFDGVSDRFDALCFKVDSSIQRPESTPVVFDENWVDTFPLENDLPNPNLYEGRSYFDRKNEMGRCTIARHGGSAPSSAPRMIVASKRMAGAVNMGLADGHVELVKLEGLWSKYWHLDWVTPERRPGLQPQGN